MRLVKYFFAAFFSMTTIVSSQESKIAITAEIDRSDYTTTKECTEQTVAELFGDHATNGMSYNDSFSSSSGVWVFAPKDIDDPGAESLYMMVDGDGFVRSLGYTFRNRSRENEDVSFYYGGTPNIMEKGQDRISSGAIVREATVNKLKRADDLLRDCNRPTEPPEKPGPLLGQNSPRVQHIHFS